jgi:hypothetical protein
VFTVEDDAYYCQMSAFCRGYPATASFKDRLEKLVGWYREEGDGSSVLVSSESWHLALDKLFSALSVCHTPCPCD